MQKVPLVFFGNERIATGVSTTAPTLRALITAGYDIKAVVSNYERGTSRNARRLEIQEVAEAHNIPVLLPGKPSEISEQLASYQAPVAVLVAYGKIVPQSVIDIFPKGIVNIHPSLLPLHRGPTPLESVILSGEPKTGVSVMSLVRAMDAGPVYAQREVGVNTTVTKQELADMLITIGSEMVIDLLPSIIDGSTEPQPQDELLASYDKLISKEDGLIDWSKPALTLDREVRAYAEWPRSRTTIAGKDIVITLAHSVPSQPIDSKPGDIELVDGSSVMMIATGNGSLCIEKLIPAGKNEMTTEAFLAGHKHLLK